MKAVDTNVLVRLLTADDARQAQRVRKLLSDAEQSRERFLVPIPVVLKLIWVLSAAYNCSREEIIGALENLLSMAALEFEAPDRVRKLCSMAGTGNIDLSDLLIGLSAPDLGCEATVTFDRRAARSDLFEPL